MAVVWEAEDSVLHRTVAVKVILETISESPEFSARFLREARLAASLQHPHIVPVYEFGTEDDVHYLVTPLLTGGHLGSRLREGPVPAAQVVEWVAQLASALDHAHSEGIVHRDVKPSNVLFDGSGRLYLTDFGIARSLSSDTSLTMDGALIGTPAYMAPEQIHGELAGPRSDQYALGIVTFSILTGRLPFEEASTPVLLARRMRERTPAPSTVMPGLPTEIDQVVLRALAEAPENRWETCTQFASALDSALLDAGWDRPPTGSGPVPEPPVVRTPPGLDSIPANPRLTAVTPWGAGSGSRAGGPHVPAGSPSRHDAPGATMRPARSRIALLVAASVVVVAGVVLASAALRRPLTVSSSGRPRENGGRSTPAAAVSAPPAGERPAATPTLAIAALALPTMQLPPVADSGDRPAAEPTLPAPAGSKRDRRRFGTPVDDPDDGGDEDPDAWGGTGDSRICVTTLATVPVGGGPASSGVRLVFRLQPRVPAFGERVDLIAEAVNGSGAALTLRRADEGPDEADASWRPLDSRAFPFLIEPGGSRRIFTRRYLLRESRPFEKRLRLYAEDGHAWEGGVQIRSCD